MPSKEITDYKLMLRDGTQQKGYISCWNSGQYIGYIDFRDNGSTVKSYIHSSGSYVVGLTIDRFDSVASMLREESPVYLGIHEFSNGVLRGYIGTSSEPVGEEEGS